MDIPKQIKMGDVTVNYEECNYYQQVIYREIISLVNVGSSIKDDVARIKHNGVIEYLIMKLRLFGSLTPAKNFYEQDQLTESM